MHNYAPSKLQGKSMAIEKDIGSSDQALDMYGEVR